jgi:hypothetical protein
MPAGCPPPVAVRETAGSARTAVIRCIASHAIAFALYIHGRQQFAGCFCARIHAFFKAGKRAFPRAAGGQAAAAAAAGSRYLRSHSAANTHRPGPLSLF